jgi:hypothetical protein
MAHACYEVMGNDNEQCHQKRDKSGMGVWNWVLFIASTGFKGITIERRHGIQINGDKNLFRTYRAL